MIKEFIKYCKEEPAQAIKDICMSVVIFLFLYFFIWSVAILDAVFRC